MKSKRYLGETQTAACPTVEVVEKRFTYDIYTFGSAVPSAKQMIKQIAKLWAEYFPLSRISPQNHQKEELQKSGFLPAPHLSAPGHRRNQQNTPKQFRASEIAPPIENHSAWIVFPEHLFEGPGYIQPPKT